MRTDKQVSFETGFGKTGKEYGQIQAHGDIRNILVAFLLYLRDINPNGYTNSHLGCTMNLVDYDMKVRYGQFGGRKEFLGLVFSVEHNWYNKITEGGYTQHTQRTISTEARKGILTILKEVLGEQYLLSIWNHEDEYCHFSLVLNLPVTWTESKIDFEKNTEEMVAKLNRFSKSLQAVTV